jgi:peptidyl-prolyl cis-trans isomerase A (cyclophilin A)
VRRRLKLGQPDEGDEMMRHGPVDRGRLTGAVIVLVAALCACSALGLHLVGCRAQPSATIGSPAGAADPGAARPARFLVRLETTKGDIVIEVHRDWAPHGADRFYELVRAGYYDEVAFSRVIAGRWAQFGINGDPQVANAWRARTIPDDPFRESNVRGTVAFAFAVPHGRTTQVFINLGDNQATHDKEPFVPFGRVVGAGMEVADALYAGYGENAGSGIRSGKQEPIFEGGNAFLRKMFPRLDYVIRARVESAVP